ncbi:MAG: hypothetical protein O6768_06640, partial [Planctomycetota bacterium]|nr:hypothetical protein [Planctomycetota bacterium]
MMGVKSLADQFKDGTARFEGNLEVLDQLASAMVSFELGFEILPGTKAIGGEGDTKNPFRHDSPSVTGE